MKKDSLLKSSLWISISGIFSRILAVVYIIPWNIWIGPVAIAAANTMYGKVYNIYNLFLIIATAGIPAAISKEVAAHNAVGNFYKSEKLLKKYTAYMTAIGIVLAAIMFFGAKYVAIILAAGDMRVVTPIKYLSIAILIIPALGIMRGYIQGYAFISWSAFSQVIEQIVRIAYMLYATYTIMVLQHGNYKSAVNQSTLASFIGATVAYVFLIWIRYRIRHSMTKEERERKVEDDGIDDIKFSSMLKSSAPFLLIDTIMVVLQLFDQTTFSLIYEHILHASQDKIDYLYSIFGFQANKITMILVSLAISVSSSVIPALSAMVAKKVDKEISKEFIQKIIIFTFFIIFPAAVGMIAVSSQLWTVFNYHNNFAAQILAASSVQAIFYCLFMILENVLQVTDHVRQSMVYLVIAYAIKILLQLPLTIYLGAFGPVLASTIAFVVGTILSFRIINKQFKLIDPYLLKKVGLIIFDGTIMLLIVLLCDYGLTLIINDTTRIPATFVLAISAIIGVIVYGLLVKRDGSLKILRDIRNIEIY
ncbi:putative polysaccharide biosynthesis protein [Lactobacillus terrae]|uniref:putative polysaccharide biosynthesis protein n=1 Tax=Lactobacillus terrae TaxID=2269374 RepID=UPI000C1B649B|nr:polysaccharide biosynthesis protein [Lactobacillus terrae]